MSKIKNGGLGQYDKVQSLNGIGGERFKRDPSILHGPLVMGPSAPGSSVVTRRRCLLFAQNSPSPWRPEVRGKVYCLGTYGIQRRQVGLL